MPNSVSLRRRLTWHVILTLLLMTTLSGALIYRGTTQEADEIFSASLVQTARILDGLISLDAIATNRARLKMALDRPQVHEYERKLFFVVLDESERVLLQSREAPQVPHDVIGTGFSEFEHERKRWLTYALESSQDDLRIIVGERSDIRDEITEYIGGGLLLPLVLLLPLALWLLWQVVGMAMRPLQQVTDQVRQQALKDLKAIDVEGVPREISPLVAALNQMIEDLDAAYARERRFVSDASHEMRNPLASLLIHVENALEENQGRETLDSLQSMKISIQRLSHLVSQLLELSHFDNPQATRKFETVDLGQVCRRVVDTLRRQAEAAEVQIEFALAQDCRLPGAEALLDSLVTNLVDNAIKYSGPGSRIRISCQHDGADLVLAVDDSGVGLDAEQRDKVLGRFYRAGDTNSAGAGLGLSIVKSIAQIHDARLELNESELGGLGVTVRFPIG